MNKEEFDEWQQWFDSHKEPDGSIILNKHPALVDYLKKIHIPPRPSLDKLMQMPGLSNCVNFDLKNRYSTEDDDDS